MLNLWSKMLFLSTKFGEDERGVTGIECGLLVAGISIAILSAVFSLGAELNNLFGDIGSTLDLQVARCAEVGSNCDQ